MAANEGSRRTGRELIVAIEPLMPLRMFLKDGRAPDEITVKVSEPEHEDPFSGIRCPLCGWRPSSSSLWCCDCVGTPEPYFQGCGMVWNTFATKGRCPGCSHQWRWTSCLRCHESSLHNDWYEARGES
jgi:hypothetical protein